MRAARYTGAGGAFGVLVPEDWVEEDDPEGGLLLARPDGAGLLHLLSFERDEEEELDPAEELYAFLAEQEIELEEDEVEDIALPAGGALALCEYLAEDDEELAYFMVAVATAPGGLVFANYSCPAGEEEAEQEAVRAILQTLRLG